MNTAIPTQRQFLVLAIPNMLSGLAVLVTQLVDIAYLGHLDSVIPLSGVLLATVIFDFIFWTFSFLRIGTTGLVAQASGREDTKEQEALFWRAALLGISIGTIIMLLQVPIGHISFEILAGESSVEEAGRDYYDAHILGAIPVMMSLVTVGWLLGQGRAGLVLIDHTIWQVSNIILNYIFIIEMDMGAFGAGLGTACAEWIALIYSLWAVYHCWGRVPRYNKPDILHIDKLKQIFNLNSAIMLRTLLLTIALAAFTNISATFGTIELAANALMLKLFLFYAYVVDGYAVALETFAGRAHGRNNKAELKRSFILALTWSLCSAIGFIVLYMTLGREVLGLLTEHTEVIDAAIPYLTWLIPVIFVGGAAFVYDGFFYGLARPRLLFRSFFYAVLVYTPIASYAWHMQSTNTLWVAFLGLMIMRCITLTSPTMKALR